MLPLRNVLHKQCFVQIEVDSNIIHLQLYKSLESGWNSNLLFLRGPCQEVDQFGWTTDPDQISPRPAAVSQEQSLRMDFHHPLHLYVCVHVYNYIINILYNIL